MTRHYLPERCWREQGSLVNHPLTPIRLSSPTSGPSLAMRREATRRAAIVVLLVGLLAGLLMAMAPTLYSGDPPQMTAARLKKQVLAAIHTGAVNTNPPRTKLQTGG